VLFSTNLITSNSSYVDVPWMMRGTLVTLPHRVIIFPLNKPILPNEGTTIGFPNISQVIYVIIFTCVSSFRTQSMSKSHIRVLMHCISFKISGKLIYV
jgi:hypothetical protein